MTNDGPDFEAADAVTGQRQQLLIDHANALICCEPTTLAGAVALMRYVASLDEWQEPVDRRDGDIDDTVRKWNQVFLNTMARARKDQCSRVMSELDSKDVLADLFGEELPFDDPERVAEMVDVVSDQKVNAR